jgi:hypothetical protein
MWLEHRYFNFILRRTIMSKKLFLFLAAISVLALAGLANAVEINNSGFEEPVLTNGDYTSGDPPDWKLGNYNVLNPTVWIPGWSEGGVWNPDTTDGYSGGAAFEGQNVGYVASYTGSDAGISQVLTVKLTADTEYVLSAAVGNPLWNGSDVSADYRLELLAGGVLLDSDTGASPASGDWALHSLTYTSGHSPAQLGQPLEIRLIAVDYTDGGGGDGYEVDFDSVTLTLKAPIATNPYPKDGDEHGDEWVYLSWTEGTDAVEHDVYFGTDFDDVKDANENDPMGPDEIYKIRQTDNLYEVDVLVPNETDKKWYYWRIDEVNDANSNSPWKGQVWSFWLRPEAAWNPSPPDGAMYIDPNIDLSWEPGFYAQQHEVLFGTDPCSLTQIYRGPDTTYNPGPLLKDTTYYWRIKELQPGPDPLGPIWSFTTTLPTMGTCLYEYWDGITPTGNSLSLLYNWPDFPGNPTDTNELTLFEGPTDRGNQFGARIQAWLYAPVTGDYKFWIATDDNGELWLSTDDSPANKQLISTCGLAGAGWAAPQNWSDPDVTPSGLIPLVAGEKYYIEGLMKEGSGGDNIAVGWTTPFDSTIQVIPGSYLEPFIQWWAWDPSPVDGAPEAPRPITLRWQAGSHAAQHEVYFGASEASMTLQDTLPVGTEEYDPGTLDPGQTYYWKVNEVNVAGPDPCMWEGEVWSFTTSDYLVVEDFESYQYAGSSSDPNGARYVWKDGWSFFPAVKSGSNLMLGGIDEPPRPYLHYNGYRTNPYDPRQVQGMVFYYDNDGNTSVPGWPGYVYSVPKYSEMEAATTGINGLGFGRDWLREDRRSLSLWFRGHPARDGSFSYTGSGLGPYTATIISDGTDIWNNGPNPYHDEFHYAYQFLLGSGGLIGTASIIARVDSVENTNGWAKAGVMMRASLAVDANHATVVVTPGQGVSFQYRDVKRGASTSETQGGITAPHWVRLQRDNWGTFYAYHANDAEHALAIWNPVNNITASQRSIYMDPNIYIGLAVTSHNAAQMCTAQFSGVEFVPDVGSSVVGPWQSRDIGIISNDPEPLYLALQDTGLNVGIVKHNDPNAALIETWTEWNIDLADANFASLDMHNIDRVHIGLGDRNTPTTGGKGVVYFDDIRLYPTRCFLSLRPPDFARVDYVPDCVVDYKELAVMAGDWLVQATDPATGNLVGWWKLDDANGATAQDSSIYVNHGTLIAMNPASDWVTGRIGGALHFDGVDDYVDCANDVSLQITGTEISLAAWVKYDTAEDDSAIAMKTSSDDWIDGYGLYADTDAVNFYVTDYGFRATKSFTADDQWHHVVGTYDGSNVRVWVDAVEGTPFSYTGSISNAAHSLEIGRGASNSYNFSGALDDVRLYNVALTDTDILDLLLLGLQTNLYEDMNIDFKDFAELAVWWLDEQLYP